MEAQVQEKYRYDLDGLRGIAIAFVVIFHVFVGRVSGGVDVFLLLSGYFFLGSQLRYAARRDATLNPWWPVWRMIRRLFPVLVTVVMVCAVLVVFFFPDLRRVDLARQLIASVLYYQNWELAIQKTGYQAASWGISPLQHLWSMSVQGQFYLLGILFALGCGWSLRLQRRRLQKKRGKEGGPERATSSIRAVAIPVLSIVTIVSFGYAAWLHPHDQQLNYYSTWSRMWELSLGALLALIGPKISINHVVRSIFTIIGLAMVITTGFLFDGAAVFPGPATLYPLGGAVLVILGSGPASIFLASRSMRWLGDIAYTLYLWHWPLLILSLALFRVDLAPLWLGISVIAVSVLLADLSHRFIEKPLRQKAPRPRRGEGRVRQAWWETRTLLPARRRAAGGVLVGLMMSACIIAPPLWINQIRNINANYLDPQEYPGARVLRGAEAPDIPPEPDPYLLPDSLSMFWNENCMSGLAQDPTELPADDDGGIPSGHCVFGDPEASLTVYLTGGSHADQWGAALDILGKQNNFRVIPFVRQSCPSFVHDNEGAFSEECAEFNKTVRDRIIQDQPDVVISNSTRPMYELGEKRDSVPEGYVEFWDFLKSQDIPFVGLRDNPWFFWSDGKDKFPSICAVEEKDTSVCGMASADFYDKTDPARSKLLARDMVPVDTRPWFCPDGWCGPEIGNIWVYRDSNHISDDYSRSMAPLLWEKLKPVIDQARKVQHKRHHG
ncbi:acyltransferase family protein [Corynebacterium sp. 3HC-13]|uniref:acyltransferase family protein n=1 Tax=Corynebacterium poyangense TaxID=2684405 RepID=UPI001CCA98C5|nr:acyltransferase family protein [Corynebacterium poyangense]MBZ8176840.1 acyltransferase family protein [Corynebacterium poyangense]